MVLIFVAAAALIALGAWCFITANISLSAKNAVLCRRVLFVIFCAGAAGALLSYIIFAVMTVGDSSDNGVFIRDSFNTYVTIELVFILICFAITTLSVVLKSKMRGFVVVVNPMWAFISLFVTLFCALWLSYTDGSLTLFVCAFGSTCPAILALPVYLIIKERARILSDRGLRSQIINARREKKALRDVRASKRRDLREKKNRLKHPKK